MTKYYYSPASPAFDNETLYVVMINGVIQSTYSDCLTCGCKYWHSPLGLDDVAVSISKCKARKLLKAWNPAMEMPS